MNRAGQARRLDSGVTAPVVVMLVVMADATHRCARVRDRNATAFDPNANPA